MMEGMVITTQSPVTRCFLRYHVKWRSPIAGGRTNDACRSMCSNSCLAALRRSGGHCC